MKHNSDNDKVEFNGRLITKDRARYILVANRTPVKQQASSYLISLVTMPLLVAYDLGRVVLGGAGIVAAQGLQVLGARDDRTIELLDNSQHMMKNGFIGLFTTPSYILYPFTPSSSEMVVDPSFPCRTCVNHESSSALRPKYRQAAASSPTTFPPNGALEA